MNMQNLIPSRIVIALALLHGVAGGTAQAQDAATLLVRASPSLTLQPLPSPVQKLDIAPIAKAAVPSEVDAEYGSTKLKRRNPEPDQIDLAALYYYAKKNQPERVAAETARLASLFPGFVPPADLYVPESERVVDETSLWELFAADDFTGIDAEYVRRKTEDPKWEPSEDFAAKLAIKKRRAHMTELAANGDALGVISAAGQIDPSVTPEIDLVWKLIDAYAATGAQIELVSAYQQLLARQGDLRLSEEDLVTTVHKAVRDFPAQDVRQVVTSLWPNPNIVPALKSVMIDLVRKDIGEFNADKERFTPIDAHSISIMANVAMQTKAPGDLALLGWYHLKREEFKDSSNFFELALDQEKLTDHAKGLYLALVGQRRDAEAYKLALANLETFAEDPEFLMNVLSTKFSKPEFGKVDEAAVTAYSTSIMQMLSADHAEILAWYAYNSRQFKAAEAWFTTGLEWEVTEQRVKGLALTYLRLNRKSDYSALRDSYAHAFPDIWETVVSTKAPKARAAASVSKPKAVKANYYRLYKNGDYSGCVRDLNALERRGGLRRDAALIKGWCTLALGRLREATDAFSYAMSGSGQVKADGVYGAALTMLRGRLTDDAETLINVNPMTAKREKEVRAEIFWQRARSSFNRKNYQRTLAALDARARLVAEPRDLTQLRAWSLYHLGYAGQANVLFKRLNMHLTSSDVTRGVNATTLGRN